MEFNIEGKILAFEILDSERFTILTKQGILATENNQVQLKRKYNHPILRRVEDELFLVVESRCKEDQKNAAIYNLNGKLQLEFVAGDAIQDILVFEKKFVFSYFDEGVMVGKDISKDGLVIFNKKGKPLWGFNTQIEEYKIWDCYNLVKSGKNKVIFFGYGKFPILEMDINSKEIQEIEIPLDHSRVDSISVAGQQIFFKIKSEICVYHRIRKKKLTLRRLNKKMRSFLVDDNLAFITSHGFEMEKLSPIWTD